MQGVEFHGEKFLVGAKGQGMKNGVDLLGKTLFSEDGRGYGL